MGYDKQNLHMDGCRLKGGFAMPELEIVKNLATGGDLARLMVGF